MTTPKPTLSRHSSRTEITAQSEESSAEASSEDSQPGLGNKRAKQPPALEQRPRPRAGTWVAATASSGASSTSEKAAKPREKASEPVLSPRGPLPPIPKSPSGAAPSSSTPSNSIPSTSTPSPSQSATPKPPPYVKSKVPAQRVPPALASVLTAGYQGTKSVPDPNNPAKVIQVHVFNIPPKQIARLIIALESNFYDNQPSGDNLTKPLRDRFGIVGFEVSSAKTLDEINVIEQILQPFMQRIFESPEAEQARVEVRERFNAFVSGPYKNLLNTEEGKNIKEGTLQNLSFRNQFDTVVQPLESYICGPDRRLESSPLPAEFKSFLKEVVRSYCSWSEKQNISPQQLTGMIKSALVGLLFIRGLLPNWNTKFEADLQTKQQGEREWSQFKGKLTAQLAHYTSFLFDDFVYDIIAATDGKPEAFEQYLRPTQKATELRRKEAMAASHKQQGSKRALTRGSTISGGTTSNTEKRTTIGSFIQGLVSPRKKEPSSSNVIPVSPRVDSSKGLLLKKTDIRSTQVKRGWARELNHYLKSNKLSTSDPGYIRQLNSAIANRGNYEMFELAPAAFCLQQLEDYLETIDKKDQALSDDLKKVQILLSTLAIQERKQAERDVQQAKRQAATNTSAAPATVNSPLSKKPTFVPNLDLGGLKNSPFAEDPIDSENTSASTKTEPSDSTDVETEGSQDEQVANNNIGNVKNEKNKD
jgi:hypothetical protein